MKMLLLAALLSLLTIHAVAGPAWNFSEAIAVTDAPEVGVFHHLDSAGRKNIAVSGELVAITWEDNSSGKTRVYLASKKTVSPAFTNRLIISGDGDAYEPAITGLGDGRFLVVWEEDNRIWARSVVNSLPGAAIQLSTRPASQASAAGRHGQAYAVWREQEKQHPAIRISRLVVDQKGTLNASKSLPVESTDVNAPQLYPSIAVTSAGLVVAWEDRRAGHTRLLYSHSKEDASFAAPEELNEYLSNRNAYDKGNGVTRVALAAFGTDEVLAVWMDKRRSNKGYGIYAAFGSEGGAYFGPNERVQGTQGDELPHYNPAVAGNSAGDFLVAWDDYRSGSSDIWLSRYTDELAWSEDFAVPPASGAGEQSSPSLAMDERGGVHLAWIERSAIGKPTQIWYTSAQRDTQ